MSSFWFLSATKRRVLTSKPGSPSCSGDTYHPSTGVSNCGTVLLLLLFFWRRRGGGINSPPLALGRSEDCIETPLRLDQARAARDGLGRVLYGRPSALSWGGPCAYPEAQKGTNPLHWIPLLFRSIRKKNGAQEANGNQPPSFGRKYALVLPKERTIIFQRRANKLPTRADSC